MYKSININLIFLFLFLSACQYSGENKSTLEFQDDLGRKVMVNSHPKTVMSLSPSITEILFLICPDSQIIGRTPYCNYPIQALNKPVVNNYPIDYEKLLALKPDIIFCKEGIISMDQAAKLESMHIPLYFQYYNNLNDIYKGITRIGQILNHETRAAFVVDSLKNAIENFKVKNDSISTRPKVLFMIGLEKIFVFGKESYVSELLEVAGGVNAVEQKFSNTFPQLTSEYVMKLDPDIIILTEAGKADLLRYYPEWEKLKAVSHNKVYSFSADLISRPGPRVGITIQKLKEIIQPDEK